MPAHLSLWVLFLKKLLQVDFMNQPILPPVLESLFRQLQSSPRGADTRLIETHISWVILAGDYAYKIKKPVNLGFLDFSSLEKRCHFCREEIRLNRRLAPTLYLGLVHIAGEPAHPRLEENGDGMLECAIKLKRFQDSALGSELARHGKLNAALIDDLATTLASFHERVPRAPIDGALGSPDTIHGAALTNFDRLREFIKQPEDLLLIDELRNWTQMEFRRIHTLLQQRKHQGHIRECHGDLHLGNLVLLDGRLTPFDCIEFSEDLRWIDTLSELAFIVMDLEVHGYSELAWRLLNRYLSLTGDYGGMVVFDYYRVYRAMVRAKIAALTLSQHADPAAIEGYLQLCRAYLHYAARTTHRKAPITLITHGFSGSGKSQLAQQLAERLPAIRISSDIERKRLAGLDALAKTNAETGRGLYSPDMTHKTYNRLLDLGKAVLQAGYSAIIDASFLKAPLRDRFQALAEHMGVAFAILALNAPLAILRERINARLAEGADPSEANLEVLDYQLRSAEPLSDAERSKSIPVDTSRAIDVAEVLTTIRHYQKGGQSCH